MRTLMQVCVETMMHLTCTNMPVSELENALDKVLPCTRPYQGQSSLGFPIHMLPAPAG